MKQPAIIARPRDAAPTSHGCVLWCVALRYLAEEGKECHFVIKGDNPKGDNPNMLVPPQIVTSGDIFGNIF